MAEHIALPAPRREGPMSVEQTLVQRRSVREFTSRRLGPETVGQLLWAAQGLVGEEDRRTAPSAGALYPLEVYAVTPEGVEHYLPEEHALERVRSGDVRAALRAACGNQEFVTQAPLTIALCAVYRRIESRYGARRGPRYVHFEAGHAAQNVLLQAVALGLGGVPVGAFDDEQVHAVLGTPEDHPPLYLLSIGEPA
jgi:SagB-type dehydrogenase family enzyme